MTVEQITNLLRAESKRLKEVYAKEYAARGLSGRLEEISKKQRNIKNKLNSVK
tara:strand:- start:35 stop:193 length:159 start_codon:yes stop_codon:yes gene_type:complete